MPSTRSSDTEIGVIVRRQQVKYRWPGFQLNFWLFIQIVGASVILGINAYFITVQNQLQIGIPWYFTYWVTVGSLALLFYIVMLWLMNQNKLTPSFVLVGTFILFVLFVVGLIIYSIELWGASGVSSTCSVYVDGMPYSGRSIETLAWLEQKSICQSWIAAWSFELVGSIFLLWMWIIAYQVRRDE